MDQPLYYNFVYKDELLIMDNEPTPVYDDGKNEYCLKQLELAGQTIFYVMVINSIDTSFFMYKDESNAWKILYNNIIDSRYFNIESQLTSYLKAQGY